MRLSGAEQRRTGRLGVRVTATVVAAGVVGVALTLSGLLLVTLLHRSLISGVDGAALARAHDVSALASAGRFRGPVASTGEDSALVQVVGPTGEVLASTGNINGEQAALVAPPASRTSGSVTRSGLPIGDQSQRFRVMAVPVVLTDGPGWIYVASSLRSVDATIARLVAALVVGLPTLLLVVTSVIWLAVGRALRPVERIRLRAAQIGGEDLQARVPVPRSRDEVARLAVTMNDMLARLQASAGRQQRFVGDASHELKSPLTALRAQVDVALNYPERTDGRHVLMQVQQESCRMAGLIDDLLFLARVDEGSLHASGERVDLDELVIAEVHRLRHVAGITVSLLGPDAAAVTGSSRDLTRLLRNLGDNAAAHASSAVEIGLRTRAGSAIITVTDDGPGVPADEQDSVFERFTRLEVDRTRHPSGGGSGLGLAITREIARVHGGDVSVRNRDGGNRGAVFTVRIPVCTPEDRSVGSGRRLSRVGHLRREWQ
jgi:signal transduction histidine kinase